MDTAATRARKPERPSRGWPQTPIAIAAAALGAAAAALATQYALVHGAPAPIAVCGFLLAGVVFAGAARATRDRPTASPSALRALPLRFEAALVIATVALALFFRAWRFGEFPPGLWYDEAIYGVESLGILRDHRLVIWSDSGDGRPTLLLYVLVVSIKFFGTNEFALRAVPVAAGLAAVCGFWLLARRLLTREAAIVSSALFAVARWAVTFSRITWEAALVPAFEVMSIYLLLRALESRNRLYFLLGGIAAASGLYTYVAFRMVPVMIICTLIYIGVRDRELIRRSTSGLVILAAAFAITVAPLATYSAVHPDQVLQRTRAVSVTTEIGDRHSLRPLLSNAVASLKMMNSAGDRNGRSNIPGAPMLDPVTAALLVLGLAVTVMSVACWRKGIVVVWLVLALVPGALTITAGNPSAIRDITALPPVFLLAGVSVEALQRALQPLPRGILLFAILASAAVAGSAAINYNDFFHRQLHDERVYDGFDPAFGNVGKLVAEKARTNHVYVSSAFAGHPAVLWLANGRAFSVLDARNMQFARDQDTVIVLALNDRAALASVEAQEPEARVEQRLDPFGRSQFIVATLPAR